MRAALIRWPEVTKIYVLTAVQFETDKERIRMKLVRLRNTFPDVNARNYISRCGGLIFRHVSYVKSWKSCNFPVPLPRQSGLSRSNPIKSRDVKREPRLHRGLEEFTDDKNIRNRGNLRASETHGKIVTKFHTGLGARVAGTSTSSGEEQSNRTDELSRPAYNFLEQNRHWRNFVRKNDQWSILSGFELFAWKIIAFVIRRKIFVHLWEIWRCENAENAK